MYRNKIKSMRQEKGMIMEELAELSGISVGYLCHLEKGTRNNPSIGVMDKIAIALGQTIEKVFFE